MPNMQTRILFILIFMGCQTGTGCDVLTPPEGQLECTTSEDCPPGWICSPEESLCYSDENEFMEGGPDTGADADTDTDGDADTDTDTDADTDTDGDADTDTDTDVDTDTDGDADTDTDTDVDTDTDGDADTDADTDSDSDADTCDALAALFIFEADEQGFEHGPMAGTSRDEWELGTPSDQQCHSGNNCFATSLGGDYRRCIASELVSPTFNLSPCAGTSWKVAVKFWHYYTFETYSGDSWNDGGAIQLSGDGGSTWQDVTPLPAYQGVIGGDYGGPCQDNAPELATHQGWSGQIPGNNWVQVTVPVDETHMTESFRFRFLVASDRETQETGWFIDDVELVIEQ